MERALRGVWHTDPKNHASRSTHIIPRSVHRLMKAMTETDKRSKIVDRLNAFVLPTDREERDELLDALVACPALVDLAEALALHGRQSLPEIQRVGLAMDDPETPDSIWIEFYTRSTGRLFATPFARFLDDDVWSIVKLPDRRHVHATVRFI